MRCPFATSSSSAPGRRGCPPRSPPSSADSTTRCIEQGVLVNSIYRFPPQMVFFTTPELLEIGGLPFVSPYEKPTRAEALRYYRKVVDTYDLQIAFDEKVLSVTRETAPAGDRIADGRVRGRDAVGARASGASVTRGTSSSPSATTTTRTARTSPAKICRTSITTTASRTRTTGSASSSSAAATRRPNRRSRCSAPART